MSPAEILADPAAGLPFLAAELVRQCPHIGANDALERALAEFRARGIDPPHAVVHRARGAARAAALERHQALRLATLDGERIEEEAERQPPEDEPTPDAYAAAIAQAMADGRLGLAAELRRAKFGMDQVSSDGPPLELLDPAAWHDLLIPARSWLLEEWMPRATTTLFTGSGGVGKSLMAQQLATAVASGLPFFGIPTLQCPAIYLTCEDRSDELHRRQAAICTALGRPLASLSGLSLVSLVNQADNMLATFGADNKMTVQRLYNQVGEAVERVGAGLLVLDNVAHLFGGNEIAKVHVAAFIGLLNSLCERTGVTVLLIAHPNKAGDAYSGNVAWENQVRSRIYLDRPRDANGFVPDLNARVLSRDKSNYAMAGATVAFRWHEWAFVSDADVPPDERAAVAALLLEAAEDRAFLTCLDAATEQRRNFGHVPGSNYAPKRFAEMSQGKGFTQAAFKRAMERLAGAGVIEFDALLWMGENRHSKRGIRRVTAARGE